MFSFLLISLIIFFIDKTHIHIEYVFTNTSPIPSDTLSYQEIVVLRNERPSALVLLMGDGEAYGIHFNCHFELVEKSKNL